MRWFGSIGPGGPRVGASGGFPAFRGCLWALPLTLVLWALIYIALHVAGVI